MPTPSLVGDQARECQIFCEWSMIHCSLAALTHQLPQVAGSTSRPAPVSTAAEACASLYGPYSDSHVHQPPGWSALPSHTTTRPPCPPLESNVVKITAWCSQSRGAESCSRWAHDSLLSLQNGDSIPKWSSLFEVNSGKLRDELAHSWPWGLLKYAFPPVSLFVQSLCKIREDEEQVLLVAPYWPTRTWFAVFQLIVRTHSSEFQSRESEQQNALLPMVERQAQDNCGTFSTAGAARLTDVNKVDLLSREKSLVCCHVSVKQRKSDQTMADQM
ncbi:Membrane protein insertase YidC [Labeo rohita]|uniref:Membrane protein insertase YidC n=1 Tax=Labeo rohita TaxID=84645 RepID=A0ABQ8L6T4_LABRO|nr:Membrane protein insertase YidC [Labeo rohita]